MEEAPEYRIARKLQEAYADKFQGKQGEAFVHLVSETIRDEYNPGIAYVCGKDNAGLKAYVQSWAAALDRDRRHVDASVLRELIRRWEAAPWTPEQQIIHDFHAAANAVLKEIHAIVKTPSGPGSPGVVKIVADLVQQRGALREATQGLLAVIDEMRTGVGDEAAWLDCERTAREAVAAAKGA